MLNTWGQIRVNIITVNVMTVNVTIVNVILPRGWQGLPKCFLNVQNENHDTAFINNKQ